MAEFLFEIGLEEVPARMIAGAQAELERRVVAMLERERLVSASVVHRSFSTPRRLAVWVSSVADRQEDLIEELLGPSAKIAFKDGVAAPAAIAFAKKAGVAVEDLKTVTTPKGEYLQATVAKPGRGAAEVIAGELPKELAGIYWAKNMYWRPGKPERFVRPVRWLVALLGEAVVPVEFAGYTASNITYGHRVLYGPGEIVVGSPSAYEGALQAAFVIVDVEARRHTMRKALDHVTRTVAGLRWREDQALVDSLTHLVEWASDASVVLGDFEPEYLALPEEVLVTVMRDHQKYFALEDTGGRLAPHFLAVLNMQADAAGLAVIRHGNARVLRARFNDARFFWEFDQRTPLVERFELLEHVTFQKELGSYAAKSERVRKLASTLGRLVIERGIEVDLAALDQAALLAKTDLTCELVKEFTELQGIVGGRYAEVQGLSRTIADAIYDQYLPKSMEDSVPRTVEGALLAIADKADTIAGMFSLGLAPTGSKDPFALRRAANGVVKILAETEPALPLHTNTIADAAREGAADATLLAFFNNRQQFYLHETCGYAPNIVGAALRLSLGGIRNSVLWAEAFCKVSMSASFLAVCDSFKRMANIAKQAAMDGFEHGVEVVDALMTEPAEKALLVASTEISQKVFFFRERQQYEAALESIAMLRPQVDAFFEAVMVMAPEPNLRVNRLALIDRVRRDFPEIEAALEVFVTH